MMQRLFARAAGVGRLWLIAGLVVGLGLPDFASAMTPWLPELILILLSLAALRVGPRDAVGSMRDLGRTLGLCLVFQLVLPVAAALILAAAGTGHTTIAAATVMMLAAPSISGSPNLAIMTGQPPAPALRLLVIGTAILPATSAVVFFVQPGLGGEGGEALGPALRLLLTVIFAGVIGFGLRRMLRPGWTEERIRAVDGLTAIFMGVLVIGLMSAAGRALQEEPGQLVFWLAIAFALNFLVQIAARLILRRIPSLAPISGPAAIVAGNRNTALFLTALPPEVAAPLMLFIGCYQIPMYLTPLLLDRFYRQTVAV